MIVKPSDMPHKDFYRLLITTVAPRPIGWVSTISREGVLNLAPFSFFNVLCPNPPILGFSPGVRTPELRKELGCPVKDTLQNVRETGEFVVNVVTYALAEAMNLTSGDYDASVDEFAVAGLTTRPSEMVRPPHVAESPVNFECKVYQIIDFGTESEGSSLVMGQIVAVHMSESVLKNGRVDGNLIDHVGRMGGMQYTRTTERFNIIRPEVPSKAK